MPDRARLLTVTAALPATIRTSAEVEARGPPLTRYLVAQLADDHTLGISRAHAEPGYLPRWSYRDGPLDVRPAGAGGRLPSGG